MNEYGCNPTDVTFLAQLIYDIGNITLPTDPCLYDTIDGGEMINKTKEYQLEDWVIQVIVNAMDEVPCQIWINNHIFDTFIEPYDKQYLIDYDYWFGDNGKCNTENPEQNEYEIVTLPCDKNCSYQYVEGIV